MVRVVMLTAAAGPGLNVQYGDVFETDQATADRLLEFGAARPEEPDDKGRVAKRDMAPQVVPAVAPQVDTSQRSSESDQSDADLDADESENAPASEPAAEPAPARRATRRR